MPGEFDYRDLVYEDENATMFPASSAAEYPHVRRLLAHQLKETNLFTLAGGLDVMGFRQIVQLLYAQDNATQIGQLTERLTLLVNYVAETRAEASTQHAEVIANQKAILDGQARIASALNLITVPAWTTKREVEQGDSMGLDVRSAEELGIRVEWGHVENEPGYEHEQVYSLDPPAGSFTRTDGVVKVTLNLQG